MNIQFDEILERLFEYFQVFTIKELADKMGVTRVNISHWKQRNSINPVKRKCVELGIYQQIFSDINQMKNKNSSGNTAYNNNGIQVQNDKDVLVENKDSQICSHQSLLPLFEDACKKAQKSEDEIEKLKKILGKYIYG